MMYAVSRILSISALLIALTLSAPASHAVIISYVNPGPNDGAVQGGFTNIVQVGQPGLFTTTDFLNHPQVFSRADTAIGHGTFPLIESTADARTEFATDLNSATATGTRSVVAPITNSFSMEARGQTYQAGPLGNYSSNSFVHSGEAATATAIPWTIFVDPSLGETAGDPVDITIDASVVGVIALAGTSTADATWNVTTTTHGSVMAGTVNTAGAFNDLGSLTFTIPLGSTFELFVNYDLNTAGNGAGASSASQISASLVQISSFLPPVAPPFGSTFRGVLGNSTTSAAPAGPYKKNRTIPVKFDLFDENGVLVTDALAATLDVRLNAFYDVAGAGNATIVDPGDAVPDSGDAFRYLGNGQYIFNLGTKHADWIADYSYKIEVDVDGAPAGAAFFGLR